MPIKAFGESKSLLQWTRDPRCKVNRPTLKARLQRGWKPKDAITEPPTCGRKRKQITAFGETKTIQQWLQDPRCKVKCKTTLTERLRTGMQPELAITTPPQYSVQDKRRLAQLARKFSTNYKPGSRNKPHYFPPKPTLLTKILEYNTEQTISQNYKNTRHTPHT